MLEWLFRVVSLVNLDYQRNRRLFTVGPGFADVLVRDRVNVLEIGVAPPLRHPPAKLGLAIGTRGAIRGWPSPSLIWTIPHCAIPRSAATRNLLS